MNTNDMITPMLDGLTVLELDSGGLAEFAGKLLADSGADVIKIEPPTGASSRRVGPFLGQDGDRESGLQFEHYNTSKRSVVLDLESEADRAALKALAAQADIVLDGLGAGVADRLGIGWQALQASNPGLIYCSITPFGVDGPWSGYAASDLTQLALGGVMASCGYDDLPDDDPIAPIGGHAKHLVGMMATMATLAAAFEKGVSGNGQFIDVSAHESIATSTEMAVPFWIYQQRDVERHTARHAMPADTPRWQHLCADGKYLLALPLYIDDARFAALVEWFDAEGMAEDLGDEKYRHSDTRENEMFHVVDVIGRFCAQHDSDYMFREAQARRLPWAPVNSPDELLRDEHFTQQRDTFVEVGSSRGTHRYAKPPFLVGNPAQLRPAPTLGAHTNEVLNALLESEYDEDALAPQRA
ncbi:CoA transferase [Georgenia subflava]|uniref:CoA transferase n=1 Tax=Georgenia subflava TaxID=1622177 RepID=UPI00186B16BB|nr:CaiB/BaiF CoA-transferase family protein [Georgenia subflava]